MARKEVEMEDEGTMDFFEGVGMDVILGQGVVEEVVSIKRSLRCWWHKRHPYYGHPN